MDDKYIALAKRILKTHEVSVEEKRFGIAVIKGNKPLRKDEEHCVDTLAAECFMKEFLL